MGDYSTPLPYLDYSELIEVTPTLTKSEVFNR